MEPNVGKTDKIVRYVLGIILFVAGIVTSITGSSVVLGMVLVALAVVLWVTGVWNFCPLYKLAKINTRKEETTA